MRPCCVNSRKRVEDVPWSIEPMRGMEEADPPDTLIASWMASAVTDVLHSNFDMGKLGGAVIGKLIVLL